MHRFQQFVIIFSCLIFIGLTPNVSAQVYLTSSPTIYLAANAVSLEQAVKQTKKQTGGRILSAETTKRNGQRVHRIKVLLPDGTVRVKYVNAN